jgi:hypothetical protein
MLSQINTGFFNALKLWPETWTANTAYTVGDVVKKTGVYNSHSYKCTVAGTSHLTTEPTWPTTNGTTITDGTVTWTCFNEKTYQLKAGQSDSVPYVVFGLETSQPIGDFEDTDAIEDSNYWINCFSDKSPDDVAKIADEVSTCLKNAVLTVTGYTSMKVVRTFIGTIIWDSVVNIYQVPLRFRLWNDKT